MTIQDATATINKNVETQLTLQQTHKKTTKDMTVMNKNIIWFDRVPRGVLL